MTENTFWNSYGKYCKRRTRTYIGNGRFYYGRMIHVQYMEWRNCDH